MSTRCGNVLRLAASLAALAVLASLCGCSSDALVDERNIYYIRGMKLREAKNHAEAAQAFETCLRLSPQSAQAHLQLAMLYDEPLNDALVAVYHYRRFLEMRPDDANAETVKGWLAKAEEKLRQRLEQAAVYAAINQGGNGSQAQEALTGPARELALLARVQELTAANEELRKRLDEPIIDPHLLTPASAAPTPSAAAPGLPAAPVADAVAARPAADITPFRPPPLPAGVAPVTPPAVAPAAAADPGAVRYHVVVAGDTLSSLSRRYYSNVSYWPQLQQANRDLLGGKNDLKLGMKLRIPPVQQMRSAPAPTSPRKGP